MSVLVVRVVVAVWNCGWKPTSLKTETVCSSETLLETRNTKIQSLQANGGIVRPTFDTFTA